MGFYQKSSPIPTVISINIKVHTDDYVIYVYLGINDTNLKQIFKLTDVNTTWVLKKISRQRGIGYEKLVFNWKEALDCELDPRAGSLWTWNTRLNLLLVSICLHQSRAQNYFMITGLNSSLLYLRLKVIGTTFKFSIPTEYSNNMTIPNLHTTFMPWSA